MISEAEWEAINAEAGQVTTDLDADISAEEDNSPEIEEEESVDTSENNEESAADDESSATDEKESTEEETSETFSDLLNPIPSPEQVDAKYAKARIPNEIKTEIKGYVDNWRETNTKLEAIGGEKGVEVFKPFAKILTQAEASEDERTDALKNILTANYGVGMTLLADGAGFLLSTDALKESYGNRVATEIFGADIDTINGFTALKASYGEKATPEHLKQLLQLEEAGYVNTEEDLELFRSSYGGSDLYESQKSELVALKQQIEDLKANPEKLLAKDKPTIEATNGIKDFETELGTRIENGIAPLRERGKWSNESRLAKTVQTAILSELKNEPEYKEALKQIKQSGQFNANNMVLFSSLNSLSNKAKARFSEAVSEINKELRGRSETSRNAQLKMEKETKPKAAVMQAKPIQYRSPDAELDAVWKDYDNILKDAQVRATRMS